MAKKDLLGGFEFKKFDGLNNGINIPVTNSMRVQEPVVPTKPVVPVNAPKKVVNTKSKKEKNIVDLPNLDYKGKNVKPMVNVIPTSTPKNVVPTNIQDVVPTNAPKKQAIIDSDINLSEYGALKTKDEKVVYLAMRGWSLKVEQRRNSLFHYATKYISRKKKRIYLGSVNN